jgi:peptidoglycan/xylan/chitin deacetylase (PgdA/CDA1 family)
VIAAQHLRSLSQVAVITNAHSTFFITGRFANEDSDCAAAITKHGHEIGNHT